jgi:hypothetical protein
LAGAEEAFSPIALDEELMPHVFAVSTDESDEQGTIDDRLFWRQDKRALQREIRSLRKELTAKLRDTRERTLQLPHAHKALHEQDEELAELRLALEDKGNDTPPPVLEEDFGAGDAAEIIHRILGELVDLQNQALNGKRCCGAMCDFASALHMISRRAHGRARHACHNR